ncbi:MAG: ATP-binding protein [Sideroxydans sp.]|nr:ATP-binding protein [Sideroxydans sp.]
MLNKMNTFFRQVLKRIIMKLLEASSTRFAVLFLLVAVLVSMVIVAVIDWSWDGRFNAELQFAGVVTPFLDGLFLLVFIAAMLDQIRKEAALRKDAEAVSRRLNEELEIKVQQRTQQLLSAQEELVRKEKLALLGQVADNVGHELRNPLGVMNNAVYFLQTVHADSDATTKEYLGIIKDEIADAERIVSDLLDAVRSKPPHPEPVNVAEWIAQALRKCDIPATVNVSQDMQPGLPPASVDPMHLHQVLWNLFTNAVEAMPGGGTLQIGASEAGGQLRISVKDSGCGMTAEQQAKLFQPLFTTKPRRIGLGLVVVKNLTQLNGGSVSAQSEPGKGSTFTVTLPRGGI